MGKVSPRGCGVKAKRNAVKMQRVILFITDSPKKKKVVSRYKKGPEMSGNLFLIYNFLLFLSSVPLLVHFFKNSGTIILIYKNHKNNV